MNTILLAEDDENLRKRFKILLENKGFQVFEAKDGEELFNTALNFFYHLDDLVILSDTDMPRMDGYVACQKLIEKFPEYKRAVMIGMSCRM